MKDTMLIQRWAGVTPDGIWGPNTARAVIAKARIKRSSGGLYSAILQKVLEHEGGFVDHPRDPGGATNKGVTQAVYDAYRTRKKQRRQSVRHIAQREVEAIYRNEYWDRVSGDDLPDGVNYAVFDYAVNSGVHRASRHLQRIAGVRQDGIIGPATLAAVDRLEPRDIIKRLCDERLGFMRSLRIWPTFGKGWTRRVRMVRRGALELAA